MRSNLDPILLLSSLQITLIAKRMLSSRSSPWFLVLFRPIKTDKLAQCPWPSRVDFSPCRVRRARQRSGKEVASGQCRGSVPLMTPKATALRNSLMCSSLRPAHRSKERPACEKTLMLSFCALEECCGQTSHQPHQRCLNSRLFSDNSTWTDYGSIRRGPQSHTGTRKPLTFEEA